MLFLIWSYTIYFILQLLFSYMGKIPMVDDSIPEQLQCTNCLLPMQYQEKKDGKFLWQCFKCGKKFFVSENIDDDMEETWSPPR